MKNVFWGSLVVFFAFLSCAGDDDSVQNIDQIFNLYIKNAEGKDLLNRKTEGAFTSVSGNDIFGITDTAPVSLALKATADSTLYLEYIAGARRLTLDSISPSDRTYHSRIELRLTQPGATPTSTPVVTVDTLEIQYHWTPSVFEVSRVFYNKQLMFTKAPNTPNIVTVIK